jgi:uncharacterized protein (TIGR02118 family)
MVLTLILRIKKMIKVTVIQPNSDGVTFDVDYYCNTHMPMVGKILGDALKSSNVDYGLAVGVFGEKASYVTMSHLIFDSIDRSTN